jgi:hypothetical protein
VVVTLTYLNWERYFLKSSSMRYSLLSRFQGTLLGMFVAEAYALRHLPQSQKTSNSLSQLTKSTSCQLLNFANIEDILETQLNSLEPKIHTALAIAIPIALLNHEQLAKRQEQLSLAVTIDPTLQTFWEGMLAISHLISQAFTEKLEPKRFIAQMCNFDVENCRKSLRQLESVQSWLEASATLDKVRRRSYQLETDITSLAIYSFLSTPEDYVVTVQRAFHLTNDRKEVANLSFDREAGQENPKSDDDPVSLCALAGALSGAYNGFGSIPATWRLCLDIELESEIEQLSQQLLAAWSGVYQPQSQARIETNGKLRRGSYAIAAPQVMSGRRP